ncbi:MAG: hypothetical protein HY814_13590 [Candidatus Riflebacteria bacterium]|nr:hypothetical protein [Candidatus Riflebacteria bacterium]
MQMRHALSVLVVLGLSASCALAQDDMFDGFNLSEELGLAPRKEPKDRTFTKNNKKYVPVYPGDTFASLAKSLYGDESLWRLIYWANKSKLPDPKDPNKLFGSVLERSKTFVIPPPSHQNPVYQLDLTDPKQIGEKEAKVILEGMGLMNGERSFQSAIKGLKYGYTYTYKNGKLNDEAKGYLFREYNLLKQALDRYGELPNISSAETPELFDKWMNDASKSLTALPAKQRLALMKALMSQETGQTHWVNYRPVMGAQADTGFGQFIPATAMAVGINPYDPAENIKGIAIHLNGLIRSFGLKEALAHYNGGNDPPAASYRYAASIMGKMKRYMK